MNCRKVRFLLPLLAGGEVGGRRARRVERHLGSCPGCRRELEEIKAAVSRLRETARSGALEWDEKEWRGLVGKAMAQRVEPRKLPGGLRLKPIWAMGFLFLLGLGLTIVFLSRIREKETRLLASGETRVSTAALPSRSLGSESRPGVPTGDRPYPVPPAGGRRRPDEPALLAKLGPEKTTQDVLSMTLVSQETGLKVHWTFNRNFTWEEKKK